MELSGIVIIGIGIGIELQSFKGFSTEVGIWLELPLSELELELNCKNGIDPRLEYQLWTKPRSTEHSPIYPPITLSAEKITCWHKR